MKKIISLFKRDYEGNRQVYNEVVEGAEWVLEGEGRATQKFDGTCAMIRDGKLYKRYDAKKGKTPPPDFEPAQDYDEVTGHLPGWVPVKEGPEDRWFREAFERMRPENKQDGTYELCGPKVQGNPEHFESHQLVPHGCVTLDVSRDFDSIKEYLREVDIEGIVWHHPDGRMVKIKKKDFGFKRYSPFSEEG